MLVTPIKPKVITVITTYKCSAACKECCFQCSPKLNIRLSYEDIKNFISSSVKEFGDSLKVCVFTGGECTLLGDDLFKAITLAKELGLSTRIVTNASWAKTKSSAEKMISKLVNSGLDEINYSTGDNHQEWIPLKYIKNAVKASFEQSLSTTISIESFKGSNFSYDDFINDPEISKLLSYSDIIQCVKASWIPLKNKHLLDKNGRDIFKNPSFKGCDSILMFLGINPQNILISCCGLTMEYIPSMKLGSFNKNDFVKKYQSQFYDFLKIWLFTDGPEKILKFACENNENLLKYTKNIVHPCQACSYIYNIEEIQNTLVNNYHKIEKKYSS